MRRADEDDFRDYVAGRLPALRRTAYLFCHDWHRADDLVAVTLGKLYRSWSRARRVERLDAYVHRIMLNAWQDEGRRESRHGRDRELPADGPAPSGPDVVERLDQLELLRRLPERQRAAVVLRFYCDLSVQETAAALGVTDGTVKSLTSRGLAGLRLILGGSR
jgi:RNA polymerase sigma-70 factor (sigma-E family)